MPELTDDQLDGLFRKSAEEFDPPFDPAAWRDMKPRLDANDRNLAGGSLIWKNLLRWGLPIGLLLLLSGGSWYAYRRAHPVVSDTRSRSMPKAGAPRNHEQAQADMTTSTPDHKPARTTPVGPKEFDDHAVKQPTDLVASVAEPVRSGKRLDKSAMLSDTNVSSDLKTATNRSTFAYGSTTERTRGLSRSALRPMASVEKGASKATNLGLKNTGLRRNKRTQHQHNLPDGRYGTVLTDVSQPSGQISVRKRRGGTNQLVLNNPVDEAGSVTPLATDKTGSVVLPTLTDLTARPATWPKLTGSLDRPVVIRPDTTARRVVPQLASPRGLSIRAVVAPDLSTVGLKNFSRPGTNVGLLLEYRLASRWSVQAGVLQSSKVYRALPEEYTVPVGAWGGPVKPLSVDGRCNMLDIPVNLRYDVLVRPQADGQRTSRWFVSGGITSYIMKQEDYVYNYPPHTYRQIMDASVSTGSYGLSHVNLSVGYERSFSRRLAWQIEPFIKMPLRGVGYFSTDLFSTGAFLSIRYTF